MGAWIETMTYAEQANFFESRPAWARGLKLQDEQHGTHVKVAPRVGAWIETFPERIISGFTRRAPRGRVD